MSNPAAATTVDLLRHGACADGEIYRGITDSALTEAGKRQMTLAVGDFRAWTSVVSSPLSRCAGVAAEFAAEAGVPLKVDAGFREVDFGAWEGRPVAQVWEDDPEFVASFYRNPAAVTPPDGEPMLAAQSRAVGALRPLLQRGRSGHHLVVSHGGIIRLLLAHLLSMPLTAISRLDVGYACLARVRVYHTAEADHPVLVSLRAVEDWQ